VYAPINLKLLHSKARIEKVSLISNIQEKAISSSKSDIGQATPVNIAFSAIQRGSQQKKNSTDVVTAKSTIYPASQRVY
jgi:hypothetical protein